MSHSTHGDHKKPVAIGHFSIEAEPADGLSPLTWYRMLAGNAGFFPDPAQQEAAQKFEWLYLELLEFKAYRQRLFRKTLGRRPPPKGLYLHGSPGRGKSLLMDAFFANLPYRRKRRVHFHHFMHEVHNELKLIKAEEDPLELVAGGIARKFRVLCLDEFHVNDIGDAMILGRLLEALFRAGIVLVTTSNYPMDSLYKDGLQRDRFLPTIELLKQNLMPVSVDGPTDYRLQAFQKFSVFHTPLGEDAEHKLAEAFETVSGGRDRHSVLMVNDRPIQVKRLSMGAVWFEFRDICGGPRSQLDYLEIAREYHTVVISNVPRLRAKDASEARRFTLLVDVLYDNKVKLMISAEVSPHELYTEGVRSDEFERTVSRLLEMQTAAYLGLPHLSV